jgi:hypothetical protein
MSIKRQARAGNGSAQAAKNHYSIVYIIKKKSRLFLVEGLSSIALQLPLGSQYRKSLYLPHREKKDWEREGRDHFRFLSWRGDGGGGAKFWRQQKSLVFFAILIQWVQANPKGILDHC